MQERTAPREPERCSMPFAQTAARLARCPSILLRVRLCTAALATLQEEKANFGFLAKKEGASCVLFFAFSGKDRTARKGSGGEFLS